MFSSRAADDALLKSESYRYFSRLSLHSNLNKGLEHNLNPVDMFGGDRPGCSDGTRVNLLQEIERWIHDKDQPNIFLLTGGAGTGKSTVATTITERYRYRRQLGCHLSFMRGKSDSESVIRTMAYRLASLNQTIAENIDDNVKAHGEIKSATMMSQFKILLHGPLHSSAQTESEYPILVVLDALDECGTEEDRKALLRILKKELPTLPSKYRFLLTSRPEGAIVSFLSLPTVYSVTLDNNSQDSKDDVRIFINSELERFQEDGGLKVPSNWPWEDNIEKLSKAADGLFIWASTALKFIFEGMNNRLLYLEELINNPKALNLNELYETVLKTSLNWDEYTKKNFPAVFSLILFGIRPLTDIEIDGILGLREGTTESLLSRLQSLVLYESNHPIRVHHASFHDYLVSCKGMNWYINIDTQKEYIAAKCFERMGRLLRFNICDLESSFIFNKDVHDLGDRIKKNIPSYLQYICCNWVHHLKEVSFSQLLCEKLRSFLYNYLLYWLEVLSLTESFNFCVGSALLYSISWLEVSRYWTSYISAKTDISQNRDVELIAFLRDAYRLVSTFSNPISQSTPHIYTSLLPLTKDESIVSKHYTAYANQAARVKFVGKKSRVAFIKEITRKNLKWPRCVSFCPDGIRIASGSDDKTVTIWDAVSGEVILGPLEGHSGGILSIATSCDGKYIASGSSDSTIRVWNAESGELHRGPFQGHTCPVVSVEFSSDGKSIVSGSVDQTVRIWDVETSEARGNPYEGHTDFIKSVSFSPDGVSVASGSKDTTVILWDTRTGRMKFKPLRGHTETVVSVAFSPDGDNIVSGSYDGAILVWSVTTGDIVRSYPKCNVSKVTSVAYSINGLHILSSYNDGLMRLWNALDDTSPPKQFRGHASCILDVSIAPDGTRFVSCSFDNTIRVWDISGGRPVETFEGQTRIRSIAISCTGRYIASGSNDHTVCVWDATSGKLFRGPWRGHTNWIPSVSFSPNEELVASGSIDGTVKIWNMISGEYTSLTSHSEPVTSVKFSPAGRFIASASRDRTIHVWDIENGGLATDPFVGHEKWINSIAYSPDGLKIVSGSNDKTVRIWDATNGHQLSVLKGHPEPVNSVKFSCDGSRIVSGSGLISPFDESGSIVVWDARSGEAICKPITRYKGHIGAVSFSPDGGLVLSGTKDGVIRAWDAFTGALSTSFKGHTGLINSICFFEDGKRFASASDDETIRIWALDGDSDNTIKQQRNMDGWVIGEKGELLMWLPPEIRDTHPTPGTISILNRSFLTSLDFSDCQKGNEWTRS